MQFVFMALCLTGIADDGGIGAVGLNDWSPVDATITFNVLQTWDITWANHALGMATWESGSTVNIVFSNSIGAELNSLDPATGGTAGSIPKPAGSGAGFGVGYNDNLTTPIWHINSWANSNHWYSEDGFSTWQTTSNPSGSNGRGISWDGSHYWQSNETGLVRYLLGGSSQSFTGIAPTQISGVAYIPGPSRDIGHVMVTTYNTNIFVLYSWDGASLVQEATGVSPASLNVTTRYGLTWCPSRSSLFFSYSSGSAYRIAELTFDVVSLSRDTWAGIKSSF
jgi:hypothetical protein